MNGILAQVIALTACGNKYLQENELPLGFVANNSTFKFCNTIHFSEMRKRFPFLRSNNEQVASDPVSWFEYLKSNDCKKLGLFKAEAPRNPLAREYQLAGFVGGQQWFIVTQMKTRLEYWSNEWKVTDKNNSERKIWSVEYTKTGQRIPPVIQQHDVLQIKNNLKNVLQHIADFAYQKDLGNFAETFNNALSTLESDRPSNNFYHTDLIPAHHYPLAAEQLLFGASKAWVFGGMGSWNDMGFDNVADNERYENLSATLYATVNQAIITAVNNGDKY